MRRCWPAALLCLLLQLLHCPLLLLPPGHICLGTVCCSLVPLSSLLLIKLLPAPLPPLLLLLLQGQWRRLGVSEVHEGLQGLLLITAELLQGRNPIASGPCSTQASSSSCCRCCCCSGCTCSCM